MRNKDGAGLGEKGSATVTGTVSKERIVRSLRVVAALIKNGEPRYWPIFDRLEAELEKQDERLSKLDRYG